MHLYRFLAQNISYYTIIIISDRRGFPKKKIIYIIIHTKHATYQNYRQYCDNFFVGNRF